MRGDSRTRRRPSFSTTKNATHIKTTTADPKNSKHFRSKLIDENRLWYTVAIEGFGGGRGKWRFNPMKTALIAHSNRPGLVADGRRRN